MSANTTYTPAALAAWNQRAPTHTTIIVMIPNVGESRWNSVIEITHLDLAGDMQSGMHWDERNIVPGTSYIRTLPAPDGDGFTFERTWTIKSPAGASRPWWGVINVHASLQATLASFPLRLLAKERIYSALTIRDDDFDRKVFSYDEDHPNDGMNTFDEKKQPVHGDWWFFPMEHLGAPTKKQVKKMKRVARMRALAEERKMRKRRAKMGWFRRVGDRVKEFGERLTRTVASGVKKVGRMSSGVRGRFQGYP
ncbi:hypothetical protein OQA88_4571 [Cercophora sp. LCS_1]